MRALTHNLELKVQLTERRKRFLHQTKLRQNRELMELVMQERPTA
jgi:hypothetical protein